MIAPHNDYVCVFMLNKFSFVENHIKSFRSLHLFGFVGFFFQLQFSLQSIYKKKIYPVFRRYPSTQQRTKQGLLTPSQIDYVD